MPLSVINFSFLISSAFLILVQIIIPCLNTHYCLEKQRKLIEKVELIIHKNSSNADLISNKLREINEIKNVYEIKDGYYSEFQLEVNYSDLLKKQHLFKHSIKSAEDKY